MVDKEKNLRPIKYDYEDYHYTESDDLISGNTVFIKHEGIGFFHTWEKHIDGTGSEYTQAVIETEDGKILKAPATGITFTDR